MKSAGEELGDRVERWQRHLPAVRMGGFLPAEAYHSDDFFDVEMDTLFPGAWVFVADLSELFQPGDYVATTVGRDPVIVLRDENGELRAYGNVCVHRGATLLLGRGRCGKRIVCPYHGWTYDLDGRLIGVPQRALLGGDLREEHLSLMPVKVGVWNRFVFVNLSGDAGDLLAWLEDVPTLLAAYGFSEQTMGPKSDFVLALNWKTVVDNNLDGYHIPMTHHDTIHRKMKTNGIDMSQGGLTTSVGWYPMREETLGSMPAPLEHCPEYMRTRSVLVAVYPTLVLSADPSGSFLISRVSPIDVGKTEVSVWAYGSSSETGGDDDEEANRQASEEGARIVQEDYAVCRRVEQGLRSRFHRDGPVHMLELQSQGLHRWIAHTLSKPSIP